ncbi:DUF4097 family beta strand repeat-containing protein [Paenibacillus solani]|uniref:DUF4097 domain-containing protein n=1 Tax=Paenibacillus solani TaxID=1705565 RepID=A0A0M1P3U3_9BACL|nr:DUF4097 family beta strand repeat-containing protein [Paenibacillus solani]KOR89156.1 hypothetical protein AM231_08255 [Paenibacillus solani]
MKKKTGVWIVVAGVVLLLLMMNPWNIFSDVQFGFSWESKKINEEKTWAANDVQALKVDTGSSNIAIIKGNSDDIKVRLDGKVSKTNADQVRLKAEATGDTLVVGIDMPEGIQFGIRITDLELTVELPEKQWKDAEIRSGSGNIEIDGLRGDTVSVKLSSGNMDIQDVKAGSLTAHTSSGRIKVADMEAESLKLTSGSGNISAERYHATTLSFQNGSGNVELKDGESAVQGKTGSGNIRLEAERLIYDTDLQVGSGNVTIDLEQEPTSLKVDYQGSSGGGKIQWDGIQYELKNEDRNKLKGTFGSGEAVLKVRTGSGNFRLE